MPVTRLATPGDASAVAALLTESREAFAPWEPLRDDNFFTAETQRSLLVDALAAHRQDATVPLVIVDGSTVVGRITLNGVTRGALQSASLGYWVGVRFQARGFATAAVADAISLAFGEMKLHRLQAETLLHNLGSQQALLRNGFRPYGVAPSYLKIAGRWQDFVLFHLLSDNE
ncbi:GNAT family N-acetyltransferase [Actinoplanes sp. NPDC051343]|uniref:GNAT family N-acetyltransferase n=1 Tax=Actinoplanes sp. NPDC051343 TaxID=3363906 RepID=UPI0037A718C1